MTGGDTKRRVANAYLAMKAIGISEDKVKPVLKKLLKLYDKNWMHIEEENYRALADAIFERDELEAVKQSKKIDNAQTKRNRDEEAEAAEDPEHPSKILQPGHQGGQTSASTTCMAVTPLVIPKEEPHELPQTNLSQPNMSKAMVASAQSESEIITDQSVGINKVKQPASSKSLTSHQECDDSNPSRRNRRLQKSQLQADCRLTSYPMKLRDRVMQTVTLQSTSRGKRPIRDDSAHAVCLKEPKVEIDLFPKKNTETDADKPITNGIPSHLISQSDTSNGEDSSSRHDMQVENDTPKPFGAPCVSEKETAEGVIKLNELKNSGVLPMTMLGCTSDLVIAFSHSGEVKVALNCDLARQRFDFHMPSLEAVLKSVEDKCFRSSEASNPDLSVTSLMKEVCECFMKFGTDPDSQLPKTVDRSPIVASVSKPSRSDARGRGRSHISSFSGLVYSRSGAKLHEVQRPINGISDGPQLNKIDAGDIIVADRENDRKCAEETNDLSLKVVQQPQVIPKVMKSFHSVFDIANGRESVIIPLVNEVNDELPPPFYYMSQNAPFQHARMNLTLAGIGDNNCCAKCAGDCLLSSTPCACKLGRGKFAYNADGFVREELLKLCVSLARSATKLHLSFCNECPLERAKCEVIIEPCKGHVKKRFIKECWWKCGCDRLCGNRVVQRGISQSLQVFMTPEGKGWGLRTLKDLPKGAFVCEYIGEVLTNVELFERVSRSPEGEKYSHPVLLDADWHTGALKDEEALCLDATNYGNVARFINHRCYDSNLVEIPVEVETPDHHYYHIGLFTTRQVKAMEELTRDYGIDFDDHDHPIKAFRCKCGSKFCRNIKRYRTRGSRR